MNNKDGISIGWFKTHYGWAVNCGYCGLTFKYYNHQPKCTECCNKEIPYSWEEKQLIPQEEG